MSIASTASSNTEILSMTKAARTFGVRVRTLRAWAKSGLSMRPFESDGRYYVEIAKTKVQAPVGGVLVTIDAVSTPAGEPHPAVGTVSPADPFTAIKSVPADLLAVSEVVSAAKAAASVNVVPAPPTPVAHPGFFVYPPALRRLY